jgi:hypothetical protein
MPSVSVLPGRPALTLGGFDLTRAGYVCEEWMLSGRAEASSMAGRPRPDGRWPVRPAGEVDYCTGLVVVRPRDAAAADPVPETTSERPPTSTKVPSVFSFSSR